MGSKAGEAQELAMKMMSMSMSMPRTPGRKLLELTSSPATPGTQTPPFHPLASVPFRWEQEPGKPRPFNELIFVTRDLPVDEYLGLPAPPPTTIVPLLLRPPRLLQPPSFRMGGGGDPVHKKRCRRGPAWFGSWRKWGVNVNEEAEVIGSRSYVFPSVDLGFEGEESGGRLMRSRIGNGCGFHITMPRPSSQLWRNILKGLKGAIP